VCKAFEKCSSVGGRKKIGVDRPRPSRFQKKIFKESMSKLKIGVDRSRESQKGPLQRQVSLMFFSTTGHGSAFDKRCSRCYTLRGCVFADVQSCEELKMLLQAKRQLG
jgi:hypothetical protein